MEWAPGSSEEKRREGVEGRKRGIQEGATLDHDAGALQAAFRERDQRPSSLGSSRLRGVRGRWHESQRRVERGRRLLPLAGQPRALGQRGAASCSAAA
ncbi:hypothetical protein H8959_006541 [Pygathrix nigripes]